MFDDETVESIPQGLDEMEPGAYLAAILSTINVTELSGHDRIVVLRAHQRMASHYDAQVYEDMAAVSGFMSEIDDDPQFAALSSTAEIRAALRLTRRAPETALGLAVDLQERLPRVWEALASGDIDLQRARTIVHGTEHLPTDTARELVERMIEGASRLTTGQLAARIRRLCVEADPGEAEQRYEEAASSGPWINSEPTCSWTCSKAAATTGGRLGARWISRLI